MSLPNTFNGLRVIESVDLTENGTPYEVPRRWRERLFSRPWRPLRATKTVIPKIPYRGAIRLNAHTYVMHPAMLRHLRADAERKVWKSEL